MDQGIFHATFVIVTALFTVIRVVYHRKALQEQGPAEFKEGRLHVMLRVVVGIPYVLAALVFMFRPQLFAWAEFALPLWAQWLGVALAIASTPLIWWVQSALGANFSSVLHVRDEHALVMHGPYRWV